MTWDAAFELFLKTASFLLSCVAMLVALVRTRKSEVERRFEEGSDKLTDHELRVARLEREIEHLPSRSELHELERLMAELKATMLAGQQRIAAINDTVVRIDDYLRNHKG